MQIRTLNQIVNELKEIANQHLQINSFNAGTLDDFATSGDTRYPAMWVSYENAGISSRTESFNFSIWIVDRVKKDRSNLIEVHSDCKSILNDIKAQLNDPGYGWSLGQDWNYQAIFEPFMEDEVAGWLADVTITQPFSNDTCQIPYNQAPIPGRASTQPTNGSVISSYVPTSRIITINGVSYDLSVDRSWTITGTTGVPYTGATQDVDLGTHGLTTDFLEFNLSPTAAAGPGQIVYDGGTGALSYNLNNSNVTSYIGQTLHAYVHNAEGVQINKGQAVYLYQASGNKASVKLAYNTTDSTSAKTFGLAAENIGAGQNGMITCQGVLDGLNTGAYNEGDTLYLGATAGTLTSSKPYAPNHLVYIGVVEKANNGNGQIYVRVQNGYELDEIHNVAALNPTDKDIIQYSSGTNLWEKTNILTAIGAASASTSGYLTSTDWNTFNNKATQDTFSILCFHGGVLNPADNTTYYFGTGNPIGTTDTNVDFNIGMACTLIGVTLTISNNTTSGTNENLTLKLRNTTQNTSSNIGTFQTNGASSTVAVNFTYSGLNIPIATNDLICIEINCPAWATNPVAVALRTTLYLTK